MSLDYLEPSDFDLIQGKQALSVYLWGDKDVNHYFCSNCGVYPFHDSTYAPGKFRINLCCVDEIDTTNLKITHFDGKNLL